MTLIMGTDVERESTVKRKWGKIFTRLECERGESGEMNVGELALRPTGTSCDGKLTLLRLVRNVRSQSHRSDHAP